MEPTKPASGRLYSNPYEATVLTDDYGIPLIPPPPPPTPREWPRNVILAGLATLVILAGLIIGFVSVSIGHGGIFAKPEATIIPTWTVSIPTVYTTPTMRPKHGTGGKRAMVPAATPVPVLRPTVIAAIPTQPTPPVPQPTEPPAPIYTPAPQPTDTPTQAPTAIPPVPLDASMVYQSIVSQLDSNHSISFQGVDTSWSGWPYAPEHNAVVWTDTTPDGTYTVEVAVFDTSNESYEDYQCQYNSQCSKQSYEGNAMQGTYNGRCLYMDNNYNGDGSVYSSYMEDELIAFDNVPGC